MVCTFTHSLKSSGYDIDKITSLVKLPPTLAEHPYLLEFYGSVDWSVRGVFSHYLGCSQTRTPHVHLRSEEIGERMIRLGGGVASVLEHASDAAGKGDFRWALKMCDAVLDNKTGEVTSRQEREARELKSTCLRSLGEKEISANGRNWYFTAALENEGYVIKPSTEQLKARIYITKVFDAMNLLTIRLCPKKSENVVRTAVFYFTDLDEYFQLQVRRGVAELTQQDNDDADLRVTVTSKVWQKICARDTNPAWAWITGDLSVSPTILHLAHFMYNFDVDI